MTLDKRLSNLKLQRRIFHPFGNAKTMFLYIVSLISMCCTKWYHQFLTHMFSTYVYADLFFKTYILASNCWFPGSSNIHTEEWPKLSTIDFIPQSSPETIIDSNGRHNFNERQMMFNIPFIRIRTRWKPDIGHSMYRWWTILTFSVPSSTVIVARVSYNYGKDQNLGRSKTRSRTERLFTLWSK